MRCAAGQCCRIRAQRNNIVRGVCRDANHGIRRGRLLLFDARAYDAKTTSTSGGIIGRLALMEAAMSEDKQAAIVGVLNRLLEAELAGVVRYTHYSFLVFGFGRIPIVSWLRAQAEESLLHAQQIGEWITTMGAYPSLAIGTLLDSHVHDIGTMLRESLDSERQALALYRELLVLAEGQSVALEEFARQMIQAEELHAAEVNKMLRKPGDVAAFKAGGG
jgi:bacterioferritin